MQHSTPPLIRQPGTKLEPGKLYARLFHGRLDPKQEMQSWGFSGPVFGPLGGVSLTYLQHLRLHDASSEEEAELWAHDDMLVWGDAYYGDLHLFVAREGDTA